MDASQTSSCGNNLAVLNSNGCEPTKFRNDSHSVRVLEDLQSLRQNEVLCDVRFESDDGKIVIGHKNVLMAASPYFRAMLSNFNESNKDLINIRELDSTILQLLVDYIYTGEIMVTNENVQVLLPAANVLQLDYVSGVCAEFLQEQLNPSNCFRIKALADLHNCTELLSRAESYIKQHFLEVVKGYDFLSLSSEKVIELISSNVLNAPSEEKVYECVINWIKHKLNVRYDSLPKLMEHVRLPLASLDYLSTNVVMEPLLKNSLKCKDYIIEAFQLHALKTQQLITIPQTIRNTPRKSGQKVILVFSHDHENYLSEIYWYDPTTSLWQILTKISFNNNVFTGVALIKNNFVFAMCDNLVTFMSFFILDLSLQSSSLVPLKDMDMEMFGARQRSGFGVIGDHLYVVGGVVHGIIRCLNSAAVFDMKHQEWTMISNMATRRYDMGVGVLNNLLYVVGGCNDDVSHLKSVECYDPILDTWTSVAEMSVCRSNVGVGVIDGLMYAVGGINKSGRLKSVEVYKPSSGVWTYIADMHLPRSRCSVLTLDGLLYVLSELHDQLGKRFDNSIEIYNPNTNTWSMEILPKSIIDSVDGAIVDKTVVTKFHNYLSHC